MADQPQIVLEDLKLILRELKDIGLSINASKCELTCLNLDNPDNVINDSKQLLPNLKITTIEDSIILGSPIATKGLRSEIESKLDSLKRMVARLSLIDQHQAFVLLKNSFAIPKLTYLLRSSRSFEQVDLLQEFDNTLKNAMSSLMNIEFSEDAWTQASLPARAGGLGIRKSEDIALPCFISSALSASTLVEAILSSVTDLAPFEVSAEVDTWKARGQDLTEPTNESGFRQRAWDSPQIEFLQKTLLDKADQFARARLLASAQPESGSWISAIPVPSLGTNLSPDEIRIAIALRTGSKICENHTCKCGKNADEFGFHLLSCKFNEGRHPRHAAINDIICRSLKAAGVPSILEPVGIDRGDRKRPDGITLFPFSQGKALCWDATCVNTYAEYAVNNTAVDAGHAASKAESNKRAKYPELVRRYRFEPVAIETSGVFGPSSKNIIYEIGKRITEKSGDKRETLWLKQRLSIAVQRGNALSIISSARHLTQES